MSWLVRRKKTRITHDPTREPAAATTERERILAIVKASEKHLAPLLALDMTGSSLQVTLRFPARGQIWNNLGLFECVTDSNSRPFAPRPFAPTRETIDTLTPAESRLQRCWLFGSDVQL